VALLCIGLVGIGGCFEENPSPGNSPAATAIKRPNIVWITLDTTRADHLGCYGYFRATSPNIDRLADDSILFEHCVVPMATTLPSHLSTLTGTYPIEHGVLANRGVGGKRFVPSERLHSFAAHLNTQGYFTAGFVSATPLKPWSGIQEGFLHYDAPPQGQKTRRADETNERVLTWLSGPDREPFFLWIHYFDPHSPYEAPEPFGDRFASDDGLETYVEARGIPENSETFKGETIDSREAINAYDGEIAWTDHQVGLLLDGLRSKGMWERTAVVLLGDHGEGIGQHAITRHGRIWGEQLHVPLLMRVPGIAARRIAMPLSSVDVFPTLLGLIDIAGMESYLEHASGIDALASASDERFLFSQMSQRMQRWGIENAYALTTSGWKYTRSESGAEQLYDLIDDPFELIDVVENYPDVAENFRERFLEQLEQQHQRALALGSGQQMRLEESVIEELKALGYGGKD
jgi:arylsulfatase